MSLNTNTTLSVALLPDRASKQQLLERRAQITGRFIPHCEKRIAELTGDDRRRALWVGIKVWYENQLTRIDARLKSKARPRTRKAAA